MTDGPKYPVEVQLSGRDGNAGTIMSIVVDGLKSHMREEGFAVDVISAEVNKFRLEAMSGDYNHLLQTCMKWVDVS